MNELRAGERRLVGRKPLGKTSAATMSSLRELAVTGCRSDRATEREKRERFPIFLVISRTPRLRASLLRRSRNGNASPGVELTPMFFRFSRRCRTLSAGVRNASRYSECIYGFWISAPVLQQRIKERILFSFFLVANGVAIHEVTDYRIALLHPAKRSAPNRCRWWQRN